METNTPSPTPSEDNHQNCRDDIMYSALDNVMSRGEQSYEDFLKTFTYLKQGSKESNVLQMKSVKTSAASFKELPSSENIKTRKEKDKAVAKQVSERDEPKQDTSHNDGIEEEVLSEGLSSCRLNNTKVIRTGSLVKFDNFVDPVEDDGIDVEELTEGEGYTSSFTDDTSTAFKSSRVIDDIQTPANNRTEISPDTPVGAVGPHLSLDEQSTDKLLMNFLADLQNELNEGKVTVNPDQGNAADSHLDIQNFLDKTRKDTGVIKDAQRTVKDSSKVVEGTTETITEATKIVKETPNISEEVCFEDEDDAMKLLQDDSGKHGIEVKISEQELKEVQKSENIDKNRTRFMDVYREALMDSEGKVRTIQAERDEAGEKVINTGEHVDNVDNILFPGQVEETYDPQVTEKDTLLEFKATFREKNTSSENQVEVTDDLIQPFQLDENFDYDNVILTPKFSSEDLQQLKANNLKSQTVVM